MATFESITWQALGALAMMLSALATGVVWTFNKVYRLGKTDQRITNIEYILDVEFREKFKAIDKRFDKIDDRFDKIDERFVKLEEKMDKRFNQIDEKFDKLYNLLLKKQ